MPTVLKQFRERNEDLKLYKPGDPYGYEDSERIDYLVSQGFLSPDDPPDTDTAAAANVEPKSGESDAGASSDKHGQEAGSDPASTEEADKPKRGSKASVETPEAG